MQFDKTRGNLIENLLLLASNGRPNGILAFLNSLLLFEFCSRRKIAVCSILHNALWRVRQEMLCHCISGIKIECCHAKPYHFTFLTSWKFLFRLIASSGISGYQRKAVACAPRVFHSPDPKSLP